ncbi:TetR/AcrR family transcriptional regulator [Enterocloster clostridioformis]|uniref:TetR/AcrR family transcriptional regulator n=1 Tax=Enterocloster clostridioformis TaxID=1531 RepID=UPI0004123C7B|nr:TetR/AcrR family transcriptional regulator [Enterocloster clostridioformis]
MPPKAKITKRMILDTVLKITRETGFDTVNARSIANKLQCSTRPIFTCYENMDELKSAFFAFAYEYYEQYVINYCDSAKVNSYLVLPLSYIEFAQKETCLFKFLFIDNMDLNMADAADFYKEVDNEKRAKIFSEETGIELEQAKVIFLDLFLYSHGIAVLTATKKIILDTDNARKMVINVLSAFIKQEKPDWKISV